ncbi:PREDICTED: homeobox-DDT domain protein RLT1-like isoform X3 [Lupinus angustifolius]|uniref:homeobox-DDT domain protein RLT1-like isoform X3 n=1 Tax=Lupinus angustifolius TaxID=3871 RepID=UPI00092F0F6E|nr:PREDICTED: homeobox-DDT domain protein RLT1-like isoform X3 [Lupinus angustifolius]
MEGDDVSEGDINHKRGGSDENSNENNNGSHSKFANSNEGQSKPKRQMKTPFQLETLEKAYAMETYPTEKIRLELSEKLGLTDRQLQMWFCHRRLKDKKDLAPKKPSRNVVEPSPEPFAEDLGLEPESGNDYGSRSGSGSSPFTPSEFRSVVPQTGYYESPQAVLELRAIACVEGQLGEPLREDGPILGVEFDPLPPDAFGAHIAVTEQKRPTLGYDSQMYEKHDVRTNKAMARTFHEYQYPPKQPSIRSDAFGQYSHQHHLHDPMEGPARTPSFAHGDEQVPRIHATHGPHVRLPSQPDKEVITYPSPPQENNVTPQRESFTNLDSGVTITHYTDHQIADPESSHAVSDVQNFHDNAMRIERKRKSDDARSARDVEAHEMRIRKELEKQDNLRRKSEERIRKEMERQDRERKKEEERLMRERQREEERTKREQKREIERREKYLLKENLKAEKMRQKEELRKEKEAERRKAALEKATARRLARESMELIEDEQLELMELAASNKGISSIIHLDLQTLQNLESFRDSLSAFPPKSVKVKNPFAVQPWIDSEENVGNLLMAWRFFIAFADVLELWPFTLDEFVQAFHDYDSRLLGEIHIALLKVIIKDIEDVSRTPTGLGMNQIGTANSGGGHPEIVEGAYAWGFDIRNWHKHLNQLTWPEIFRQLALSAGYGPQLKKGSLTWPCANDKDEGKSIEDIISTLRNGSAAENAVAKMRHRGLLAPRKSRHRLTPGTVKFAAFHVLSLEGSKGLNVLELAEKIQKSGLRDLTTSKTPEASISVALTRDTKLFERVAPSTYRVRSTFRKDPVHAESILSEARKKIQIFENGFVAGEGADDVEREEDSESDEVDEDPEVDDLVNPASAKRTSDQSADFSSNGNENLGHNVELIQDEFHKDLPCFPESVSRNADCPVAVVGQPAAFEDLNAGNVEENTEIDESKCGESWVQGLTEGEYSDLCVEERLNALVVLVGMANEGNSIRVVLEDRLEAANALKKQMWAEAQIDKVRSKDDYHSKSDFPSINGNTVETQFTCPAVEGNQSPLLDINIDNNNNEALSLTPENQKATPAAQILSFQPLLIQDPCTSQDNPQAQLSLQYSKRSRSQLKSYISHIAEEMYVYRSLPLGQDRRRNRYWQFVACASCNDPGAGRIFVEYLNGKWRLIDSEEAFDALLNSLDSRGIRESHLRIMLQKIENSFKENVRKNTHVKVGSIGETSIKNEADETDLSPDRHTGFDSPSSTLCGLNTDTSETSLSFKIELGKSESEKKAALKRYQDFQKWMWRECYKSPILSAMKSGKKRCKPQVDICDICLNPYFFEDSHCNCCHQPFPIHNGFNFSKHSFQCGDELSKDICILDSSLPLQTRLLKALLAYIEACVPPKALNSTWTEDIRRRWGLKLSKSNSVEELLQILTLFERALQRNFLSSNYSTTEELLGSSSLSQSAGDASADPESVALLPWVPQTTPAVCLRLFEFDASISYILVEKPESFLEKEAREYMKLPSRYSPFKSGRVVEPSDLDHDEFMKVKSAHMKIVQSGNKRGRGTHDKGRGKKQSKGMHHSKQDTGLHTVNVTENLSQRLKQQGRGSQGKGGGRGRRTVRKRRVEKRAVEDLLLSPRDTTSQSSKIGREPLRNIYEEWVDDDEKRSSMSPIHIGLSADVSNSTEDVESDENVEAVESDDNGQAVEYDQGNWEIGFNGNPSRWSRDLVGMSDEDMEASEDGNNVIEDDDDDSEADIMSEDSDGVANGVVNVQGSDSSESEQSSD